MSRIGRMPITIPAGVTVEERGRTVFVKGPKGDLSQKIADKNIVINIENGTVTVDRTNENKQTKSKHGLYRMLIQNMVNGVVKPFTKTIIVNGVGFKVQAKEGRLVMNIGYSHPIEILAPEGITISCPDQTTINISGISKELVGQTAATIRSKRPVEPYHAYGLRYSDEIVIRKEGKTAGK